MDHKFVCYVNGKEVYTTSATSHYKAQLQAWQWLTDEYPTHEPETVRYSDDYTVTHLYVKALTAHHHGG